MKHTNRPLICLFLVLFSYSLSLFSDTFQVSFDKNKACYFDFVPWFDLTIKLSTFDEKRIFQNFETWINTNKQFKATTKHIKTSDKKIIHKTTYKQPAQPFVWCNPEIPISPPPPLMGKQMGSVQTLGIPPLGYEMDGNIKVFHLTAQPIEQFLTNGKKPDYYDLIPTENRVWHYHHEPIVQKLRGWGYNGQTPGPTIEVYEGDRIRVVLKNELPQPTSIHWHGIELPNNQDGASPETQRPALPGETITYEFTLYQSGTLMYHAGYNIMMQDHNGLHGMLVVHPKKYEKKIDRDIAIFLQQFSILPGNIYPNLMTNQFNWFAFNGKAAPNIPVITVQHGERVRLRFANTIMDPHPIHIHGYIWEEVGTEGGPIQPSARIKGSTIQVPSGTTRDVEFVAWNPGLWRLHCHMLHHTMNTQADMPMGIMPHGGMFTLVHVIPKDPDAPWRHPRQQEIEGGT